MTAPEQAAATRAEDLRTMQMLMGVALTSAGTLKQGMEIFIGEYVGSADHPLCAAFARLLAAVPIDPVGTWTADEKLSRGTSQQDIVTAITALAGMLLLLPVRWSADGTERATADAIREYVNGVLELGTATTESARDVLAKRQAVMLAQRSRPAGGAQ